MRSAEEQMQDALASAAVATICNERSEDAGVAAVMEVLTYLGVLSPVFFNDHMQFRAITVSGDVLRSQIAQRLGRS